MATAGSKHFVKGELPVKILLNNVEPFSFPLLPLQLLKTEIHIFTLSGVVFKHFVRWLARRKTL